MFSAGSSRPPTRWTSCCPCQRCVCAPYKQWLTAYLAGIYKYNGNMQDQDTSKKQIPRSFCAKVYHLMQSRRMYSGCSGFILFMFLIGVHQGLSSGYLEVNKFFLQSSFRASRDFPSPCSEFKKLPLQANCAFLSALTFYSPITNRCGLFAHRSNTKC